MNKTIEIASKKLTTAYVDSVRQSDSYCPVEADGNLNSASTNLIYAFGEGCWLGVINCYTDKQKENPIWQWDGEMVYNFGASFVIPEFDQTLLDLIFQRNNAPFTNCSDDSVMVDAIFDRIEAIGGKLLHWS